ncbi:MAG: septum formation initiator family protein [Actinomycetia bacterium]|nr:septum formation initiator family protein [Actinomycetes bacterium]
MTVDAGVPMEAELSDPGNAPDLVTRPAPRQASNGRTLALVGALLAIALMLVLPVRSWLTQRANLVELREDIAAAQVRVDALQQQRDSWQDPQYVEDQARLRLNMVRPGEAGLIVVDPAQEQAEAFEELPDTWWGRVWGSVESSSGRRPADLTDEEVAVREDAPR